MHCRPCDLPVDESQELDPGVNLGQVELHPLVVDHALAICADVLLCPTTNLKVTLLQQARGTQRYALMVQLAHNQAPTVVLSSNKVARRNTHVIKECRIDIVT